MFHNSTILAKHYHIPQTSTRRNPLASSRTSSENIDVASVTNQIPTAATYKHGIQEGNCPTDSTVYTAMTPSDHRTYIRYHFRWNIAGDRIYLSAEAAKEKANTDARDVLQYIYHQIWNTWNPSFSDIETFLKKRNISEVYFKKTEHYKQLKDKIKLCVMGVLCNILLRRDNTPGDNMSSWFNDLTEEDKEKVVTDKVFLLQRQPETVDVDDLSEIHKSPEHNQTNIQQQRSVESTKPGEIQEDGNNFQEPSVGKPKTNEPNNADVQSKDSEMGKPKGKSKADEHEMDNNGKSSSSPSSSSSSGSSSSSYSPTTDDEKSGNQDLSGLKDYESISSKNNDASLELGHLFNDYWRDESNDRIQHQWYLTVISQVKNLYSDCNLDKIWESFPRVYKTTNNLGEHIIYNRWIQRTPGLLDKEITTVNHMNTQAEIEWNENNYDSDFDEYDIMNDPDTNPFTPPYVYQRKDMFKFCYHIGLNSMFDIGFQQAALNTNQGSTSQTYVRDLPNYNRCPIAHINEFFLKKKVSLDVWPDKKIPTIFIVKSGDSTAINNYSDI